MLRKSRVWLVLACFLGATAPANAQEEVILTIPERRPPPAPERPLPEASPPARKPAPEAPAQTDAVTSQAATANPAPMPARAASETKTPEAEATEETAPDGEVAEALEDAGADGEASDIETPETAIAGPPPLPIRKPRPGDRPTVAWKTLKVVAERKRCDKVLKGLTIDYERLQPIKRGACGASAPILVKSIGADLPVAIEPPATVRCTLAAALDTWFNDHVQPAALATFGSPVVKIRNISSYKCRNRYNAANTKISEHAFANALDISEFELASGKKITVLKGWPRTVPTAAAPPLPEPNPDREPLELTQVKSDPDAAFTPPPEASPPLGPEPRDAAEFLRTIHADGCKTFNTVLGPAANAAHRNHFHVDMKVRRYVTICD